MSNAQIEDAMDEIIAFSELEKFIDTPIKVYSSGMTVRLGFAIAVKVDPEVLVIDEVIAVGDEGFQRKCFDYIATLAPTWVDRADGDALAGCGRGHVRHGHVARRR